MKNATVVKDNGMPVILLSFPFDYGTILEVKKLVGRSYDPTTKKWTCFYTLENVKCLVGLQFTLDDELSEFHETCQPKMRRTAPSVKLPPIPNFLAELYPFQKQGVNFLSSKNGNALLADDMGLGKTIQVLAYLQLNPQLRPAVVVMPSSLKYNWASEIAKFCKGNTVQVLNGEKMNAPIVGDIVLINYDILANKYKKNGAKKQEIPRTGWVDHIIDIKPKMLVLDEAHYIKNEKANKTKASIKLGKKCGKVLAVTGTPILNKPMEMYTVIHLINPLLFPSRKTFGMRYCDGKHNGYGWVYNGATNLDELHSLLVNSIMLRRLKKDHLKELPEKRITVIPVEMDNAKAYREAETNFLSYLRKSRGAPIPANVKNSKTLVQIGVLKKLAAQGILTSALDWIESFLESGEKLVVFANHTEIINAVESRFKQTCVKVDGSVTGIARQKAVEDFQNNPKIKLFVGNIKAAGVGLTLTAASNELFLELPWSPGVLLQAQDRCNRIGQKNAVNINYFIARNSIYEKIVALLLEKQKVIEHVLDNKKQDDGMAIWKQLILEFDMMAA